MCPPIALEWHYHFHLHQWPIQTLLDAFRVGIIVQKCVHFTYWRDSRLTSLVLIDSLTVLNVLNRISRREIKLYVWPIKHILYTHRNHRRAVSCTVFFSARVLACQP